MKYYPKFTASMMCANYANLSSEVSKLEEAGIDSFHIDIMDGSFVDNFGMGYQDMHFISSVTSKEIDVHLMVSNPHLYLPILYETKANCIYIHPEADSDPASTVEKIKKHECSAGIAINPGTSVSVVDQLLYVVDKILVLGVNPGHAGRAYQDYVDNKIMQLLKMKKNLHFEIWLDGAVTIDRILKWAKEGVDGFVLGTSCLFNQKGDYFDNMQKIRNSLSVEFSK